MFSLIFYIFFFKTCLSFLLKLLATDPVNSLIFSNLKFLREKDAIFTIFFYIFASKLHTYDQGRNSFTFFSCTCFELSYFAFATSYTLSSSLSQTHAHTLSLAFKERSALANIHFEGRHLRWLYLCSILCNKICTVTLEKKMISILMWSLSVWPRVIIFIKFNYNNQWFSF